MIVIEQDSALHDPVLYFLGKASNAHWILFFNGSFLLTGLAVSLVAARFGIVRHQVLDLDEQALYILIHQL